MSVMIGFEIRNFRDGRPHALMGRPFASERADADSCTASSWRINMQSSSPLPSRVLINGFSTVCQVTRCRNKVTNKIPNCSAQRCACYHWQVSLPYPSTALPPPSFPTRPGSSIIIDSRSEGSLTERRWTGNKLVVGQRYRCTSFAQHS